MAREIDQQDLTLLLQNVRLRQTEVQVYAAPDPWFGMTHPADHERTGRALRERISAGIYPERLREGFSELAYV